MYTYTGYISEQYEALRKSQFIQTELVVIRQTKWDTHVATQYGEVHPYTFTRIYYI